MRRPLLLLFFASLAASPSLQAAEPSAETAAKVMSGLDVLLVERPSLLSGKRIGLVTHAAAVTSRLESAADALAGLPYSRLVALMGPEHGVRGDQWAGDAVADQKDPITGIPVYSLYGKTSKPTPEMLKDADVIVYDIQDVGTRSYTYLDTLALVLEAAAETGKPVLVLDRPNPLGGLRVEGPPPPGDWVRSAVCSLPIPYNYGMTPGELALMINGEGWLARGLKADVSVVAMRGWKRDMVFADTGLPWVATSPHMPHADSPFFYAATEMAGELGVLNEGVGYPQPFELLGAPWLDGPALAGKLNALGLPGVFFRAAAYKPFYGPMKGQALRGVQIHLLDARVAPWSAVEFHALEIARELHPDRSVWEGASPEAGKAFDRLACGPALRRRFLRGARVADEVKDWAKHSEDFRRRRARYLLYP